MGMFDECRLFLMLFISKFAREVKINGLLSFLKVCKYQFTPKNQSLFSLALGFTYEFMRYAV